ncbi:MAG: glutamate-cysteine ligase family protein [Candidatus Neomarinimicrobiota bacterium]
MNLHEQIEAVILSNLQKPQACLIGVEVECIIYNREGLRIPVNPGHNFSASDILAELNVWQNANGQNISYSLEPGGQVEFASRPYCTLNEIDAQFNRHLQQLQGICRREGLRPLDYALDPLYRPEQVELINQTKYQLMHERFARTGDHGHWMMRNTASVQVNIDIGSRRVAEEMAFIADCLEPVAALLFANAPFCRGALSGRRNYRYHIWDDTDPARCGNLLDHGILGPEGLLEKYIDWVLTVPLMFASMPDGSIASYEGPAGKWLNSIATDGEVTAEQVQMVLHQIFTHVRFKHVLEVRGADRPPRGYEMAPPAFWLGLLAAPRARARALAIVSAWSIDQRRQLGQLAAELAIGAKLIDGGRFDDLIGQICDLSLAGLAERAEVCCHQCERHYLEQYLKRFSQVGPPALATQRHFSDRGLSVPEFINREGGKW